jgi:hypothetical protein
VYGLTGWHFMLILAFGIVPLTLWIIALVQIGGAKATSVVTVLWVALVTLVPLLGAVAWFAVGRRSVMQQPPAPPAPPIVQ